MRITLQEIDAFVVGCLSGSQSSTGKALEMKFKEAELLNQDVDLSPELCEAIVARIKTTAKKLDGIRENLERKLANESSFSVTTNATVKDLTKQISAAKDIKTSSEIAKTIHNTIKARKKHLKLSKSLGQETGNGGVGSVALVPTNPMPKGDDSIEELSSLHQRVCKLRSSFLKKDETDPDVADECGCAMFNK